ncbi:MAG TPA: dethiobiotin synthase [Candidatus Acidoferrales bacterium]|nr:dethiobiotin synthase [Candidatus Acidoferrales bacterium]
MSRIFVTGIGTGIGKTFVSAILVEALHADYWKPVQSGDLDNSDTMTVRRLISNPVSVLHPEAYRLTHALSPHVAAEMDGIEIDLEKIRSLIPIVKDRHLIIEGAGGAMSPVNGSSVVLDLIELLEAETVIVSRNYLGSINHTLLTIDAIKRRRISIRGLIFNGKEEKASVDFILKHSGASLLGSVGEERVLDKNAVSKYAGTFKGIFK